MAVYPGGIVTLPTIVNGTVVTAALFSNANAELAAIEAELGTNIQGVAGSLAERLMFDIMEDGTLRNKWINYDTDVSSPFARRRIMAGVHYSTSGGTVTFPWASTYFTVAPLVFLEVARIANATSSARLVMLTSAPTTTQFTYALRTKGLLTPTDQNRIFWFAIEKTANLNAG
jgi:hypothetical protein